MASADRPAVGQPGPGQLEYNVQVMSHHHTLIIISVNLKLPLSELRVHTGITRDFSSFVIVIVIMIVSSLCGPRLRRPRPR